VQAVLRCLDEIRGHGVKSDHGYWGFEKGCCKFRLFVRHPAVPNIGVHDLV
jgi:hypothetical protein